MESRVQAYRDTRHCFTKVFNNEGWAGMYRGLSLYLMHVAAEKAIKLATNDWIRDKLSEAQHGHLSLSGELLAGGCAGAKDPAMIECWVYHAKLTTLTCIHFALICSSRSACCSSISLQLSLSLLFLDGLQVSTREQQQRESRLSD